MSARASRQSGSNASTSDAEMSKAEKEALISRKMEEMRQKNDAMKKRYEEVQADKKVAESINHGSVQLTDADIPLPDRRTKEMKGVINEERKKAQKKPIGRGKKLEKMTKEPLKAQDFAKRHADQEFNAKSPVESENQRVPGHMQDRQRSNKERRSVPFHNDRADGPSDQLASRPKDLQISVDPGARRTRGPAGDTGGRRPFRPGMTPNSKTPQSPSEPGGPPPDPAFNFLADRSRDNAFESSMDKEQDDWDSSPTKNRRHPFNFGGTNFENVPRQIQQDRQKRGAGLKRGRGPRSKMEITLRMTGHERHAYSQWKQERQEIDQLRLERQRKNGGEWRREWDHDKMEDEDVDPKTEPAKRPAGRIGSGRFAGSTASREVRIRTDTPVKVGSGRITSPRGRGGGLTADRGRGGSSRGGGRGGYNNADNTVPRTRAFSSGSDESRHMNQQEESIIIVIDNDLPMKRSPQRGGRGGRGSQQRRGSGRLPYRQGPEQQQSGFGQTSNKGHGWIDSRRAKEFIQRRKVSSGESDNLEKVTEEPSSNKGNNWDNEAADSAFYGTENDGKRNSQERKVEQTSQDRKTPEKTKKIQPKANIQLSIKVTKEAKSNEEKTPEKKKHFLNDSFYTDDDELDIEQYRMRLDSEGNLISGPPSEPETPDLVLKTPVDHVPVLDWAADVEKHLNKVVPQESADVDENEDYDDEEDEDDEYEDELVEEVIGDVYDDDGEYIGDESEYYEHNDEDGEIEDEEHVEKDGTEMINVVDDTGDSPPIAVSNIEDICDNPANSEDTRDESRDNLEDEDDEYEDELAEEDDTEMTNVVDDTGDSPPLVVSNIEDICDNPADSEDTRDESRDNLEDEEHVEKDGTEMINVVDGICENPADSEDTRDESRDNLEDEDHVEKDGTEMNKVVDETGDSQPIVVSNIEDICDNPADSDDTRDEVDADKDNVISSNNTVPNSETFSLLNDAAGASVNTSDSSEKFEDSMANLSISAAAEAESSGNSEKFEDAQDINAAASAEHFEEISSFVEDKSGASSCADAVRNEQPVVVHPNEPGASSLVHDQTNSDTSCEAKADSVEGVVFESDSGASGGVDTPCDEACTDAFRDNDYAHIDTQNGSPAEDDPQTLPAVVRDDHDSSSLDAAVEHAQPEQSSESSDADNQVEKHNDEAQPQESQKTDDEP